MSAISHRCGNCRRSISTSPTTDSAGLRIDELGLEEMDRKILRALIDRGEPTGLKTLAAIVEEAEDTLEPTCSSPTCSAAA